MHVKTNKRRWLFFLLPFLVLALVSAGQVLTILYEARVQQQAFSRLAHEYAQPPAAAGSAAPADSGSAMLPQFRALYARNSDIGGWIKIEGTALDYPVMYTPDEPQKYLHRAFDGSDSACGVPFVGAGCTLSPRSENVILYSHHMKDGTMFAPLVHYAQKSYWEKHPAVTFSTLYETHRYAVFAAFETDLEDAQALRCYTLLQAADEADFDRFIAGLRAATPYDTGVAVHYGDPLLTLSTCAYHTENGRFVVVAVQLPD